MAGTLLGPVSWELVVDDDGYRTYSVTFRVEANVGVAAAFQDGPYNIMNTPGLPIPGISFWNFAGDSDPSAWCRPARKISRLSEVKEGEKITYWALDFTFSNKPLDGNQNHCQDEQIDNPLLEPPEVSGGFTKDKEQATFDRDGAPILNSSFEPIRGPAVEFDAHRPTIRIKQNVPLLQLELWGPMVGTLNDRTLWGLPARCIKLSTASWERKLYGTCNFYYVRTFEFESFPKKNAAGTIIGNGFDRDILDEGTKVIRGDWDRRIGSPTYSDYVPALDIDRNNPTNYIRFKDWNGENARVILDGNGAPIDTGVGTGTTGATEAGSIHVEKYGESNFLELGVPATF